LLRGWGAYLRTGNAADKCKQVDHDVKWRLKRLLLKRHGRDLHVEQRGAILKFLPPYSHDFNPIEAV
jgi:transposase